MASPVRIVSLPQAQPSTLRMALSPVRSVTVSYPALGSPRVAALPQRHGDSFLAPVPRRAPTHCAESTPTRTYSVLEHSLRGASPSRGGCSLQAKPATQFQVHSSCPNVAFSQGFEPLAQAPQGLTADVIRPGPSAQPLSGAVSGVRAISDASATSAGVRQALAQVQALACEHGDIDGNVDEMRHQIAMWRSTIQEQIARVRCEMSAVSDSLQAGSTIGQQGSGAAVYS